MIRELLIGGPLTADIREDVTADAAAHSVARGLPTPPVSEPGAEVVY